MTKSAVSCGFGYLLKEILNGKLNLLCSASRLRLWILLIRLFAALQQNIQIKRQHLTGDVM